jgi:hypothetical protein
VSDTPLADAIAKLEAPPTDNAELGVVASDAGGVGVAGHVTAHVGKGWSVNASGSWQHKSGWRLESIVRWTKGK